MSNLLKAYVAAIIAVLPTSSANALCSYHGQMYAKTTLNQEFGDSQWVIRAKLLAADNHWSDSDDSWTLYHLRVLTTFKGQFHKRLDMFTYRDSGGLYLDKGMTSDIGGEYLLFLDSIDDKSGTPAAARNATEVNYPCGQSKEWNRLSGWERRELVKLSQRP